jgi:nitrogen fixation/metabolism regulation signal transduction histidine kinase
MTESDTPSVEQTDPPLVFRRAWFRRRQYLIDRKGQLLTTAKIAGTVAALLVLFNVVFLLWNQIETQAIVATNPQLLDEMTAIDDRSTRTLAILSFVVLALVVVRSIRLTHRTAGAAFNLQRCLESVASGNYDTELRVRRKDNLRHLQGPFNQMTESLRRRAAEDYAALTDLTAKLEEQGLTELAEEVRQMAEAKEMIADPIE